MTLPASLGWERALLGTALTNPDTMTETGDVLPSDFSGPHQQLWAEMVALSHRGSLGPRALVEALRSAGSLQAIGYDDLEAKGEQYIAVLSTFRGEEMPEYVTRVIGASTKRQLSQTAALIRVEAEDQNIPAEEALDGAERRIMALRRSRSTEGTSMADLMVAITGRMNNPVITHNVWRPSIPELQRVIDFAEAEDYVLIAARPGDGKSSALRYEIGMPAILRGEPALLVNMENSEIEVGRAFIAMVTGINSRHIKSGNLNDEQKELVQEATEALQQVPLHIVSVGSPTAAEVERRCRHYISKLKVMRIGVDYVQLIRNGMENGVQDVSKTSGVLRSIALNFGVPVIAAAQLNRQITGRGADAEPQLSDLRESGSLEQDSSMVIFPRQVWPSPNEAQLRMYQENIEGNFVMENAVPIKMIVKKNRNGPVGTTDPFLWCKYNNRYKPLQIVELNR